MNESTNKQKNYIQFFFVVSLTIIIKNNAYGKWCEMQTVEVEEENKNRKKNLMSNCKGVIFLHCNRTNNKNSFIFFYYYT